MNTTTHYLACDLAVETGRIMLGSLSKGQLTLTEIHSFEIKTKAVKGVSCWDMVSLEKELFAGIEKAAALGLPISGLSANSWGEDYVLLDAKDRLLQSPARGQNGPCREMTARLLKKLPLSTIYAETGVPLTPLHTLSQIEAGYQADPTLFERAGLFLPIADYINARFSGVPACEESLASTTRLYNPRTHAWSAPLAAALDVPDSILPRLVPSGTAFGPVVDELRRHPAMLNTRVIATCSHDKAAATAAIPARSESQWAYLHSDTWSQFGIEIESPITSSHACEDGFTNEVGLGGSIHFLKNSVGLGLVQACRQAWSSAGQEYTEDQLTRMAMESGPGKAHIYPADPHFSEPGNMPEKITAYCHETGQTAPANPGEFVRVILESLALAHAETLRQLEALTGQEIEVLHIVGRGTGNELLNQLTADTTGLPVIVGPADAAAIGNILIQALALWHLKSPDHLRSIVFSSFPTQVLKPRHNFEKKTRDRFRALGEHLNVPHSVAA